MTLAAPTAADERAAALHEVYPRAPLAWRQNGLVLRIVFFFLVCFGAGAFVALAALMMLPAQFVTGVAAIALAEWLIAKKRFFWTGIELALWLLGVMNLILSLPSSHKAEALLVIAGGLAVAGFRLRNALGGVAAAVCVVIYAGVKTDGLAAPLVAVALTLLAAIAVTHEWQRRSTEQLLQAFVLVLPATGYVVAALVEKTTPHPFAMFAMLALALLILGVRHRDRVLLIAGVFAMSITAGDLSWKYLDLAFEWKLIDAGVLTLLIALILSRLLRHRTRGFVASPEAAKSYEEAIQLLGAMHVVHAPARDPSPAGFEAGGGGFGGGGASAGY